MRKKRCWHKEKKKKILVARKKEEEKNHALFLSHTRPYYIARHA
jgi:hypothetical protein